MGGKIQVVQLAEIMHVRQNHDHIRYLRYFYATSIQILPKIYPTLSPTYNSGYATVQNTVLLCCPQTTLYCSLKQYSWQKRWWQSFLWVGLQQWFWSSTFEVNSIVKIRSFLSSNYRQNVGFEALIEEFGNKWVSIPTDRLVSGKNLKQMRVKCNHWKIKRIRKERLHLTS